MDEKRCSELLSGVLEGLTDEQKAKAAACPDNGELIDLLGQMGVALPDELLDEAAGGYVWTNFRLDEIGGTTVPTDSNGGKMTPDPFAQTKGKKKKELTVKPPDQAVNEQ